MRKQYAVLALSLAAAAVVVWSGVVKSLKPMQPAEAAPDAVGVVFYLHLPKNQSHPRLLADLSYSPDVRAIDEI